MFLGDIGPFSSTFLGDWSSFLGPIEGLGAFAAGYVLLRRHNCHVKGCWRISRCAVQGTHYVVCHHHHPGVAPSHQDVIDAHHAAKAADRRAVEDDDVQEVRVLSSDSPVR